MDPIIRRLSLKGFRSINATRVELDNPTFLVGRNGAGKSNLLDAFAFLSEAMSSNLQAAIARRRQQGRDVDYLPNRARDMPGFGIAVTFGQLAGGFESAHYAFEVYSRSLVEFKVVREQCRITADGQEFWFERREGQFFSSRNLEGLKPDLDASRLGLPVISGYVPFTAVSRVLEAMEVFPIASDVGAIAASLHKIRESSPPTAERINEILTAMLPYRIQVRPIQREGKISLAFEQEWSADSSLTLDAGSISDGTLQMLGLLTAIFHQPAPSLIAIEEPETNLHPGALGMVLDLLRFASDRTQVIVATHSPELLEGKWIEDRHLRLVAWEDGSTRACSIAGGARKALAEHLMGAGELLRSDALDAPPLRGCTAEVELFEDLG
jgi:ABC-type lipoprotein export system ATPase subunit